MTDDAQRLKEALARLGVPIDTPDPRGRDVFEELREAAEQSPAVQRDAEYRQMNRDLDRLEEQSRALGRQIEEAARRRDLERAWDAARGTWQAEARRSTGRPFRGSGPSRLVDTNLQEPARSIPPRRSAGDVELNEVTAQQELDAALARLRRLSNSTGTGEEEYAS